MLTSLDAEELFVLSEHDLAHNNLETAIVKLKRCIELDEAPVSFLAHRALARVYAQLKLFAKAKKHFSIYLESQPDALVENFQLGMVLFQEKDFKGALSQWEKVEKISKDYPPLLFYRALVKLNLGMKDAALAELLSIETRVDRDNLYALRAKDLVTRITTHGGVEAREGVSDLTDIPDDVFQGEH